MTVAAFTGRQAAPRTEGGVTHEQAMEMFRRFFERGQCVPTIAHEMGIDYRVACDVMGGKLWHGVYQHWADRVFP